MQRNKFKNKVVLKHYDRAREVTNNLIFTFAITAPCEDKLKFFNEDIKKKFGWSPHISTFYDYRMTFPGTYDRLFQLCIISLCSDVETFFKDLFEKYEYKRGNGLGFFQRIDDVIRELEVNGIDFSTAQKSIENVRLAFQVRHIGVHNMGIVDNDFIKKTGRGNIESPFEINQNSYRVMFEAYEKLLKHLDEQLPLLPP